MNEVDNGGICYPLGTKVYKVFNDIEYADKITDHYHKSNLYHII